jgi:hypothetical protein
MCTSETGGTRDFPVPGRDGTKKKESRDGTGRDSGLNYAGRDGIHRLKGGTGRDSMTVRSVPSVPSIDILCSTEIADKS